MFSPPFVFIQKPRMKRVSLRVQPGGAVSVTAPMGFSRGEAAAFVEMHRAWIARKVAYFRKIAPRKVVGDGNAETYELLQERALAFVRDRAAHFNKRYCFFLKGIKVKNHMSRWGSASAAGNLNFNYRVVLLPEPLADYVVVHELCHLKEQNHGARFWALVSEALPDWKERRAALRRYSFS